MARLLRGGIGSGTLTSGISDSDTTITAGILANVEAISTDTMTFRLGPPGPSEELVQLTAHTLSSTSGTFTRGAEGTTARVWPVGTVIEHVPTVTDWSAALAGGGGGGITVNQQTRTAGNIALGGSTSWAAITTAHDLVIAAVAGDVIEVQMSGFFDMPAAFTGIEAFSMVSGLPVNALTAGGGSDFGTQAWAMPGTTEGSNDNNLSGGTVYTVQAGDLSGGNITLRPFYRQGTAQAATLRASTAQPFRWWVKNLGQ